MRRRPGTGNPAIHRSELLCIALNAAFGLSPCDAHLRPAIAASLPQGGLQDARRRVMVKVDVT